MGVSQLKKILLLASVLGLASCAHHGAALIESNPSGAEVVDINEGTLLGVTPFISRWKEGDERKFVNIRVQKDGYADKTTSFWVSLRYKTRDAAIKNAQSIEMNLEKLN